MYLHDPVCSRRACCASANAGNECILSYICMATACWSSSTSHAWRVVKQHLLNSQLKEAYIPKSFHPQLRSQEWGLLLTPVMVNWVLTTLAHPPPKLMYPCDPCSPHHSHQSPKTRTQACRNIRNCFLAMETVSAHPGIAKGLQPLLEQNYINHPKNKRQKQIITISTTVKIMV